MKRLIKTAIASILALTLVYTPAFAHQTSTIPSQRPETGPSIPGIPVTKISKIEPIAPLQFAQPAEVAPIPIAAPEPTPAPAQAQSAPSGGCVSNYSSGDYYLDKIINFESGPHNGGQGGGNSCITNYLGCFGLLQACPGAPLRATCGGDPGCQIAWFEANKTGGRSWAQVWQHEVDYGWW